jgi:hypothetical protein
MLDFVSSFCIFFGAFVYALAWVNCTSKDTQRLYPPVPQTPPKTIPKTTTGFFFNRHRGATVRIESGLITSRPKEQTLYRNYLSAFTIGQETQLARPPPKKLRPGLKFLCGTTSRTPQPSGVR